MLSFMLLFNTTVVYADIGGDIPTPFPTLIPTFPDPGEFFIRLLLPDGGQAADYISEWLKKRWSTDEDKSKDMSSDGNTVTFNSNFVDELNTALQNKVHALDGYYLYDTDYSASAFPSLYTDYSKFSSEYQEIFTDFFNSYDSVFTFQDVSSSSSYIWLKGIDTTDYLYIDGSDVYRYTTGEKGIDGLSVNANFYYVDRGPVSIGLADSYINKKLYVFGSPVKLFYSKQDLQNYLNKGRIYIPKLPSGGFKVNIKYINNTSNLPDITYNITTENKTEVEIQNQYDTTINNYLNGLDDFTDGGGTTNPTPTPTPSGGGSGGDLGDGTTPTPKPDFTDGSLIDTNTLLQKILDKLTEFSANHDKLAKTITDYIEANDGKLDQIIEAINALSNGKTEDEKYGCKYDFAALSDFMTKLWNESDKKFDKMVELLEENNKYQKKLVNSLNEIKAILVTQTIMDVFQDRSQQTAEKAKDKFPTSLPWDIALVVNAMSAEPEKPQFDLPIQIKSLNINEEIHVDLASGEWEKLAKTCRYLLSILFILLMIQLSRKLFSNGGDD